MSTQSKNWRNNQSQASVSGTSSGTTWRNKPPLVKPMKPAPALSPKSSNNLGDSWDAVDSTDSNKIETKMSTEKSGKDDKIGFKQIWINVSKSAEEADKKVPEKPTGQKKKKYDSHNAWGDDDDEVEETAEEKKKNLEAEKERQKNLRKSLEHDWVHDIKSKMLREYARVYREKIWEQNDKAEMDLSTQHKAFGAQGIVGGLMKWGYNLESLADKCEKLLHSGKVEESVKVYVDFMELNSGARKNNRNFKATKLAGRSID